MQSDGMQSDESEGLDVLNCFIDCLADCSMLFSSSGVMISPLAVLRSIVKRAHRKTAAFKIWSCTFSKTTKTVYLAQLGELLSSIGRASVL